MHSLLLDIPTRIETDRLYLRAYQAGDGRWYYEMSQRNRAHLMRYESGNAVMTITNEEEAEIVVRRFAADWVGRRAFFWGVFDRATDEFVAQIYMGVVSWELPEFCLGYFADVGHEGQGYVTEAMHASLRFIFHHLAAHRVSLERDDTNVRSYRVAERCGMVREGHFRENRRHADGRVSGTLHYGLLSREFDAAHYQTPV